MTLHHWQTKTSKIVYENPWLRVHEDTVVMPNGKDGLYGYAESKSDAVYIVPVDEDGNTYLIQQERYPIKKIIWECVAGRTDGQSIEAAAKRELLEETGLQAESITILHETWAATGLSTFKSTFCIARGITKVSDTLDPEDGILAVQKIPLASVPERVLSGSITCASSIAALFTTIAYLEKEKTV